MEQTVLSVQGMSCGHCVKAVEGALSELRGVKSVQVNLESATVEVEYDESKVSLETIKESIDDQGYDVA
ncbi:copper chaperone CopZ [Priestia flexa]|uniref:Copper chaperone CopZ n=2 Tax=Priestia TaxID=2800373 RepID=A0A0V8JKC8_9BACI|nr:MULTISPECIES: copper chaperone CopZ [Priestia]AQX54347.1 copper resistance protein CopZ [Priestia flexa]KSU87478.1 copper resistance protein CopZ [Priestia veravalensis]MBY6087178.1 copper chaperone CopZ [Priestia flexa]MCA1203349.1 copper chaperone CopZ [Priestia flexa]MCG7313362.1 copper chaperone CopZ [Priestia flexa]